MDKPDVFFLKAKIMTLEARIEFLTDLVTEQAQVIGDYEKVLDIVTDQNVDILRVHLEDRKN